MLKNKSSHVKQLSQEFIERYSSCGYSQFGLILAIRRLNNMGYVIVKGEDVNQDDENLKNYIEPWNTLFNRKK